MNDESSAIVAPAPASLLTRILFRIFDALCSGAVLLDAQKAPVHLNERARKCLGDGIVVSRGALCATDRRSDVLFQTVLDQMLKYGRSNAQWRREAVPLSRADNRPLIARVIPVEAEAQGQLDGAALVLLLIDPEDCPQPSFGLLKQVFDLTRTEARVASQLLSGQTLHEIAEAAGVSVGTVRSQTKAIFAKTQTNRQAELVGLLTRLALLSEDDSASP
jgi:DNA-binding CsgD family transcriptional regulator